MAITQKLFNYYSLHMPTKGEILWQLIENAGFKSQAEFSRTTGIDKTYLNNMIHGRKPIGPMYAEIISQELKIPLHVFKYLLESNVPLEYLKHFQEIINLGDDELISFVGIIVELAKLKATGEAPNDILEPLKKQAEAHLQLLKNLAKK